LEGCCLVFVVVVVGVCDGESGSEGSKVNELRCSVLGMSNALGPWRGVSNGCCVWVDDEELLGRHDESFNDFTQTPFETAILHVYYM